MLNIVIPMAGSGSRFVNAGYAKPKPFIDIEGKPMIARVMENLSYNNALFILIARKEHLEKEKALVKEIEQNYNVVFVPIDKLTEGAACTVLYSRKYINNDNPLLIANSDQIVDLNIKEYIDDCYQRKLDGSILSFIDPFNDSKWSFVRVNAQGLVQEVKEKIPISNIATVGLYFYLKGSDFVDGALDMIIENDRVNNEFYVCPTYNYIIKENKSIGIYNINYSQMHGIGTPDDLNNYINVVLKK